MSALSIIILVLSILTITIGLILSRVGSTTGLSAAIGQDLELFKKTKDRGFIKIVQIIMFNIFFIMLVLLILSFKLGW